MDRATKIFEKHRSYLLSIAYNMLGRMTDARDIVQEAYLKWIEVDVESIHNPRAYLSTVVSRLCLDKLKSAQHRHEQYIGPDLPEPVITADKKTPEENVQIDDALSMAVMFLLKKLNPLQRAVFVLREVFSYAYSDIAEIVEKSESYCRKIAQRARDKVQEKSSGDLADPKKHQNLLSSFMKAVNGEDIDELEKILAEEATLYSDGGGKVTAARKPIFGADNIAKFLVGISNKAPDDINMHFTSINGEPGVLVFIEGELQSTWTFETRDSEIENIFVTLNPEKLKHLPRNFASAT